MTTLIIPDIGVELEQRLRGRAALSGLSIEEEARRVLVEQVADEAPVAGPRDENALDFIRRLKAKHGGGGDIPLFDRSEWLNRVVDFGE